MLSVNAYSKRKGRKPAARADEIRLLLVVAGLLRLRLLPITLTGNFLVREFSFQEALEDSIQISSGMELNFVLCGA